MLPNSETGALYSRPSSQLLPPSPEIAEEGKSALLDSSLVNGQELKERECVRGHEQSLGQQHWRMSYSRQQNTGT